MMGRVCLWIVFCVSISEFVSGQIPGEETSNRTEQIRWIHDKVTSLWSALLHPSWTQPGRLVHAVCNVKPDPFLSAQQRSDITGRISLSQEQGGGLSLSFSLSGFAPGGAAHGIHIHELGDLGGGCNTLGGHFNPHSTRHGSHIGDLGNFRPDSEGKILQRLSDLHLVLLGPESVLGRSIVIHEHEDDLGLSQDAGSHVHGNAGRRLACCVIGIAAAPRVSEGGEQTHTHPTHHQH
uniref:Superoxide dismutase [Cu-Zn] n=1 Tax=Callorhinchus milii TaxID=7868 RepID=K4GA65_CALMI|nr:superoxide dismutase 3, extracellular [Callorhinchus milii]